MEIFLTSYIFILSLCLGSFLNVCIYRIPKGESIINPPSRCGNCKTRLKALDLIPVFSFLFLKGKCRYCKEKISLRYPFIELITGVLITAVYIEYGLNITFIKYSVLILFLIVIGMIDFDTTDVYFKTTLSGIITGIAFLLYIYFSGQSITAYILGAVLGGGVISLIILITRGMGWGDAEICVLCGLFLGFRLTLVMLFAAFVFGGIIGILLIIFKIKSRKDYIPFGPFLALGAVTAIFIGERVIQLYLLLL
ncbi:prepilin peptidase [Clostridium sp. SYSU_GA19001]|uniref:prepilin peptidase n=1 Tax=Clostridium caldaquaticum TaxID=2940653 RepID=UPI0020775862|nr:A24 family peptidase [Clostridium caldaquaticum]MCM8711507.1 prepilin peptidase [Clostridium caldaquaticum]